jgi:hypothetical protein
MNVFLPTSCARVVEKVEDEDSNRSNSNDNHAVIIDYASTGVGLGMSDVAMHIAHAVRPADHADGGEERLVDAYLHALGQARGEAAVMKRSYPREVAMRHYRLATIDYLRFILGRFWRSATPESFVKAQNNPNVTLINRNEDAAMGIIDRVDQYLDEFEEERDGFADMKRC